MRTTWTHRFFLSAFLVLTASALRADVRTWSGGKTGSWDVAANWVETAVPTTNDTVFIANTSAVVVLSSSTFPLASIQLAGTLIFTNWDTTLTAVDVTVTNGGKITHYVNTDSNAPWTPDARIAISCSNLNVQTGGVINADAKGYIAPAINKASYGPGAGYNSYGGGAGYGGVGGVGDLLYVFSSGKEYGDPYNPTNPGSAGGSHNSSGLGGNGGGAIWVNASGDVRVDGSMTANGGSYVPLYGAGGSGGSILIVCDTLTGSGAIRAKGGNGVTSGGTGAGGGGGRIAIRYSAAQSNLVAQPPVMLDANGGTLPVGVAGDMGTIWLPDALLLRESLANLNGQILGVASWSSDRIACTNNRVRFVGDGFQLRVTNDVFVSGSAGAVEVGRARYLGNRLYSISSNAPVGVEIGGGLILTNSASLRLFSAPTNTAPDYGALLSVTGSVAIFPSAVLSLYSDTTNGGSALIRAAGVRVAAGGLIEADAKGYGNIGVYAGDTTYLNMGVGPGFVVPNGGGCHGGGGSRAGGNVTQTTFPEDFLTRTYGSISNPISAGSTGGRHLNTHARVGNDGGGVVRIESSGDVVVSGTISANGGSDNGGYDGGGAGGSVNIRCRSLAGTGGLVRATGGGAGTFYGGGGGGGRMAVVYDVAAQAELPLQDIVFSAASGVHAVGSYQGCVGDIGTLYFPDNQFLASPLRHSGEWRVPGLVQWSVDSLRLSNVWFRFPEPNFTLTVTDDLTVVGTTSLWHRLELSNGWVSCGRSEIRRGRIALYRTGDGGSRFSSTGDVRVDRGWLEVVSGGTNVMLESARLALTNSGWVRLEAAATNPAVADHGGLVRADLMEIGAGGVVRPFTHASNGGAVSFIVGELRIASGGALDASASGLREMGIPTYYGLGPGRGYDYGAGGYGGAGAVSGSGASGGIYGLTNAPILSGSGGGKHTSFWRPYNWGGGVARVKADKLVLEGAVRADGGGTGIANGGGGGSGGSILLWVKSLQGALGTLSARGGDGRTGTAEAGGGGGRIAVWLGGMTDADAQNLLNNLPASGASLSTNWSGLIGTVDVAGGKNTTATPRLGSSGTFVALSKPRGTVILVR